MFLEIKNVDKSYQNHQALKKVSLSIPKGSIYGLLGPNGAGKTSLIRIINQITAADSGSILIDGEPLAPNHISIIGYLPEERGLYKTMKVGEQAIYLAQLKGLKKSEAKEKLLWWFNRFEITDWWDKKVTDLSKGMAQKIQFITTVLHEPKLLIFDEPFSGFDPVNADLIKDEIIGLKERGATIIFSTHRMESVEQMCDYIALINKSEVVIEGKLHDIKQRFKKSHYEVVLKGEVSLDFLDEKYILEQSFTNNESYFKLNFSNFLNPNEALQQLISLGKIVRFEEIIPSANAIFLNLVKTTPNE